MEPKCETPNLDITRGDVVTLKTDPGRPYTVLGFLISVPSYYLVSHVSADGWLQSLVRRCEIATVERVTDSPAEPDWRDAEPPAVLLDDVPAFDLDVGQPDDRVPVLDWQERYPQSGSYISACGRFLVLPRLSDDMTPIDGLYVAVDRRVGDPTSLRWSGDASLDHCKAWCVNRARYDVVTVDGVESLVLNGQAPTL